MPIRTAGAIHWDRLHLSPVVLDFGVFELRWYALSYVAMILLGWWYLRKLVAQPGAPMSREHADDFVFYATLGVILGGRIGYCLFYKPEIWRQPLDVLKVWQGGMSLHGGLIGVLIAIGVFCYRRRLNVLRVCDYVACTTPFGLFLVRIANFMNGELWGRPFDGPWAVVFPGTQDGIPRHPSQLYEAVLEGLLMMAVLGYLFWRTGARHRPGRLFGAALLLYGCARFGLEFLRQPDAGLEHLRWGLTMGQTLSAPMIVAGLVLLLRSRQRTAPPAYA